MNSTMLLNLKQHGEKIKKKKEKNQQHGAIDTQHKPYTVNICMCVKFLTKLPITYLPTFGASVV